jgi:hypothetical protein
MLYWPAMILRILTAAAIAFPALALAEGVPTKSGAGAPDAPPSIDWRGELMTGHGCKKGKVPGLHLDGKQNAIALDGGGFSLRVPKDWSAASERPNLVLVWGAAGADGVRPFFEVFVTPKCKQVDALMASGRVAARALAGLAPSAAIIDQVAKGKWNAGLGGEVGMSIILYDVALTTPKGERPMVLYSTDLGSGKTFTIRAAAACPRQIAKEVGLGPCELTYFDMLKTSGE